MKVRGKMPLVTRHGGGEAVSVSVGQVVDMQDELAEKLVKAGLADVVDEPESESEEPAKPARKRATKRVVAAPENKEA